MIHPDLSKALRLQELDLKISELRKEIATLPAQISSIEKHLEAHLKQLELRKTALGANQRERKKLEGTVQDFQQKISKLRDQMTQAKTNEQYQAFQKEILFAETEIKKAEDRTLDLMNDSEELEGELKKAEAALNAQSAVVQEKKSAASARIAAVKADLDGLMAKRTAIAQEIPAALLKTYDRLHTKMRDGIAIADATGGVCSACHMTLRAQFQQELRTGTSILACENCRRLLYFQPPTEDPTALGA